MIFVRVLIGRFQLPTLAAYTKDKPHEAGKTLGYQLQRADIAQLLSVSLAELSGSTQNTPTASVATAQTEAISTATTATTTTTAKTDAQQAPVAPAPTQTQVQAETPATPTQTERQQTAIQTQTLAQPTAAEPRQAYSHGHGHARNSSRDGSSLPPLAPVVRSGHTRVPSLTRSVTSEGDIKACSVCGSVAFCWFFCVFLF